MVTDQLYFSTTLHVFFHSKGDGSEFSGIIHQNFEVMKSSFHMLIIFMVANAHFTVAQQDISVKYLNALPKDLKLKEQSAQKYRLTCDYFNGDIFGNFLNKTRVTGDYTRGFRDGTVKWNNVKIENGNTREGPFENAVSQDYMENFSYVPSDKMLEAPSFSSFPPNSFHTKNLVWDMLAIETFAWVYFDSLKLNQTFRPANLRDEVPLAGEGTFKNRDIQLKWTGISKMNEALCALIEYRTFDNPLVIETAQIKLKGRSHYWGTIWVSLKDKQIEYATLYEDVVMEMKTNSQTNGQLLNSTREIRFEKLN
jgi:hypothetical protein